MPDYTSKYVFEAHARGFSEVNRQMDNTMRKIRELKGMGDVNVGTGGGTGGGTSSGGSGTSSSGSSTGLIPSAASLSRAVAYAGAISLVYSAMQTATEVAHRWVDAQVESNRVMVDAQVTLGGTKEELAGFVQGVKQLAYASGEAYSEASLVARRETLLNRPGMGANAAALNMVFPSLDLSTSAEDITAIQTQFKASFTDINDVLLTLVQTSGLTADELLSMSDTWGALVDDMHLGARSLTSMKEIGALMGAMSVTMGESGTTIEQFLRKLERIYTDEKVTAALDGVGISVRDVNGQFRSLTSILDEISSRGMSDQVYDALSGFFPNDLGQSTKQQFREMLNQVDLITAAVDRAKQSTADFDDALVTASQSLDNIGEKLGTSFSNWLSAIGDISGASLNLLELASGLQNASNRFSGTAMGRSGYDAITGYRAPGSFAEARAGQTAQTYAIMDRLGELFLSMIPDPSWVERNSQREIGLRGFESLPSNFFGNITNPDRQLQYLERAIGMFNQSPYRVEGAGPETQVQNFLLYMSQHGEEVNRAFIGVRDATTSDQEAFAGHTDMVYTATSALSTFVVAALTAAQELGLKANFNTSKVPLKNVRSDTDRQAPYYAPNEALGYAALVAAYTPEDRAKAQQKLDDMVMQGQIDRFN
ncbi:MAG: phage tail tape measure protein, partial [Anaerolineae bacterium]|nr:phage tail tape measure protein [Anaerolineae bacterium]